jgi:hypothetical protein
VLKSSCLETHLPSLPWLHRSSAWVKRQVPWRRKRQSLPSRHGRHSLITCLLGLVDWTPVALASLAVEAGGPASAPSASCHKQMNGIGA